MNELLKTVQTRIITSKEELLSLAEVWNLLHIEIKGTIFQTFEWNASWWDIYAQKNFQLCVFTIWTDQKLIGIMPAFQETYRFGGVTFSRLRFLATTETYGEYSPLVHPHFENEVLPAMVNFCTERIRTKECDMVSVFRFPPTSEFMIKFLAGIKAAGLRVKYVPDCVPRIMMELPESWQSYLSMISPNEKQMLLRRSRALTKQGVELEIIQDPLLHEKDYDDFVRLHNASWSVRDRLSYFSSNKFEAFQRSMMSQFRKNKIARLYYFKKDGVRFAAVQAYFINGICCFYLSGLDRKFELANQSPGKVLLSLVIKDAIEEGYKIFDFQGGLEDYKFRLGGKRTNFGKADIWKPGIKSLKVLPIQMFVNLRHLIADWHFNEMLKKHIKLLQNRFLRTKNKVKPEYQNITTENDFPLTRQSHFYVKEITTEKGLEEIKGLWNDLLMKSHSNVLYLTYEWLYTWWRCFQTPLKKIYVLVVYNGGELVGIAPFMEVQTRVFGFTINTLEFLSMVRFPNSPLNISATLDIIAKKEEHQNVIKSIFAYLLENKSSWHYIRLYPIPRKSPTLEGIKNECRMIGLDYFQRYGLSNSVLFMESSWHEYLKERGNDFGKKYRRLKNKIADFSNISFKEYKDVKDYSFHKILTIERSSWKSKSGISIDAKVYRNFYNELMTSASLKGWLSLWVLNVDGTDIAYDFSIDYNKTVNSLKSSYHSDYLDYSPGNLLTYFEIEEFFSRGITSMNFLWGDHSSKTKWTSSLIPHDEVFIFNKTLVSRYLFFIYYKLLFYKAYRYLFMSLEQLHCRIKRLLNIL